MTCENCALRDHALTDLADFGSAESPIADFAGIFANLFGGKIARIRPYL